MAKVKKCRACNHTYKSHTKKAHNGEGGCAYCNCGKVAVKMAGDEILVDAPRPVITTVSKDPPVTDPEPIPKAEPFPLTDLGPPTD